MKNLLLCVLLFSGCAAMTHGEYVYYHGKKCEIRNKYVTNGRVIYTINVPDPRGRHHVEFVPADVLTWRD